MSKNQYRYQFKKDNVEHIKDYDRNNLKTDEILEVYLKAEIFNEILNLKNRLRFQLVKYDKDKDVSVKTQYYEQILKEIDEIVCQYTNESPALKDK